MKKIVVKLKQKEKKELTISTDFIRLDSAMKLSGAAATGGEAKMLINDEKVKVNGEVCTVRGKKLHEGDCFEYKYVIYEVRR
ncbi:MAG: RNA-binding S4 domain-containing protein [Acutalibacteraceae bacterium]